MKLRKKNLFDLDVELFEYIIKSDKLIECIILCVKQLDIISVKISIQKIKSFHNSYK